MKFSTEFALLFASGYASLANAYWLMGINNFITTQRLDPIVNPGAVSGHAHSVLGGSNFGMTTDTDKLLKSQCTSIPINEDHSNYWFPHLYFQWANGSFTSLTGGAVIYYLFDDKPGSTTAFPPNLRMLSGNPTLRSYDANSFAQQAVTFLCLDFNGQTTKHNELPAKSCPSGVRAQINFPSCWDGKNTDSADHKSHVAFKSGGPDSGSCTDPKFPVTIPRIFIEVYWNTGDFNKIASQAKNPQQPLVFAHGDPTGYGYHADFINGWQPGVLQKAVDGCTCNPYGDPTCCVQKGLFTMDQNKRCFITDTVDEQVVGTLPKLPGNNPVVGAGPPAKMASATSIPALLAPVYVYTTEGKPPGRGKIVTPASVVSGSGSAQPPAASAPASPSQPPVAGSPAPAPPKPSAPAAPSAPAPPAAPAAPSGAMHNVVPSAPASAAPSSAPAPAAPAAPASPPKAPAPANGSGSCHQKPQPKKLEHKKHKHHVSRHVSRHLSRMSF